MFGLCHSVPHTAEDLAKADWRPPIMKFSYWVAVSITCLFLEMTWRDKMPILCSKKVRGSGGFIHRMDAHWAGPDMCAAEIFKLSAIMSQNPAATCQNMFLISARPRRWSRNFKLGNFGRLIRKNREQERQDQDAELMASDQIHGKLPIKHSGEYGSIIIRSLETGIPSRIKRECNE